MITEELVVERGIASVSKAPESIGGYINTKLARGEFGDSGFGASGTLGTRYSANGIVNTSAGRLTLADERHRLSVVAELDDGDNISTPVGEIRPSGLSRERYDLSYALSGDGRRILLFAGQLDTIDAGMPTLPMDIRFIETDMAGLQFGLEAGDGIDEQPTPAYELVNVAFSWNAGPAWRIEARVDNLLDETYQDHLAGINRAMGSGIPVGTRLYGAERTVSAGVVFTF